ncbi:hypothetical protein DY000_02059661 [Brassica cretica]|uniref:BCAS3 domain-containing protein n=1 Tax=Brassica cretica TaxID=69181 RepID=A0ABQ7AV83_BRACR|nr:hypothetical protein DY000_02059661 [Brassica cretica]
MRTDCEEDGSERIGSLTPSNKKSYKVTNRIQEGKKPLYDVVFNFFDSRFFNVFVTAGGNKSAPRPPPRRQLGHIRNDFLKIRFIPIYMTSGAGTSSPPENGTSLPPRTGASLPPRTEASLPPGATGQANSFEEVYSHTSLAELKNAPGRRNVPHLHPRTGASLPPRTGVSLLVVLFSSITDIG